MLYTADHFRIFDALFIDSGMILLSGSSNIWPPFTYGNNFNTGPNIGAAVVHAVISPDCERISFTFPKNDGLVILSDYHSIFISSVLDCHPINFTFSSPSLKYHFLSRSSLHRLNVCYSHRRLRLRSNVYLLFMA